jgi:hypothetical protein
MAQLSVKAGATSQSILAFVQDATSTTGAGLAAVAPAGGSLLSGTTAYFSFTGTNATATVISLSVLAAVNSAWSSGGIVTLDDTHMKGWVRLDLPNAVLAAASGRCVGVHLYGGTNMAPCPTLIELTGTDNQDGVHFGLTCLPNAAIGASNALIINGLNDTTNAVQLRGLTFSNNVTISGAFTVTGTTTCTGNVSMAAGLTITQSTVNGIGLSITGNGSGSGTKSVGGATGHGHEAVGGATSGNAFYAHAGGNGLGMSIVGTGQVGFYASSDTSHATYFLGGSGGDALRLTATGSNIDLNLFGSTTISGNLSGKVQGNGAATISGPGAWVLSEAGADLAKVSDLLTSAQVATTLWQDTTSTDFTTAGSPGYLLMHQLEGTFTTTSSSVFTVGSLVNAPTGGSAPTTAQIATAVWTDTTANDFNVAHSIGQCSYINNVVPGASGGLQTVGTAVTLPANPPSNFLVAGSFAANSITDAAFAVPSTPTGLATGMMSMLLQVWRRFYKASKKDSVAKTIVEFADDGVTPVVTQSYTTTASVDTTDTIGAGH